MKSFWLSRAEFPNHVGFTHSNLDGRLVGFPRRGQRQFFSQYTFKGRYTCFTVPIGLVELGLDDRENGVELLIGIKSQEQQVLRFGVIS